MSRGTQDTARMNSSFDYRTITFYGSAFQKLRLESFIPHCSPTTPYKLPYRVWAIPRSLATTEGISFEFLFLQVLRCFSSLGLPHIPIDSV